MDKMMTDMVRIQLAMLEGWISGLTNLWRGWQHVLAANAELLRHPAFRRWHNMVPNAADWLDHYGRRAHDVDVEHMR